MSFKLFDQGITPDRIKRFKEQQAEQERAAQEANAFGETEHILSMLRFIEAGKKALAQLPEPPCPIQRKPLSNLLR